MLGTSPNCLEMLGAMLGAACLAPKMLGVHVRCTGFPFKKEQTERYHRTIYSTTKYNSLHEKYIFSQVSSI